MQAALLDSPVKTRKPWKLFLVLAVCAAPLVLSYFFYYVVKPAGRTNYGDLLDPRLYPMPVLQSKDLKLQGSHELTELRGKWILLMTGEGGCDQLCQQNLYHIRQVRTAQGKEMQRVERLWLITDQTAPAAALLQQFAGTHIWYTEPARLKAWLPVAADDAHTGHIYLIDPLGNLMMRFPKQADPVKLKKDLSKLLKASAIG